ncbi:hypothetical protein TEA_002868 [Camellia sinensis var. sinensis]|uniref:Glycosyltransferase N-terminal domain-containing protein n=1 Tax=Camellia sinensis var. sinensis TaxID=542762 RepID=A0A4S4DHP2_CAMSN|nr:hypothetical protein TEA_002868 [Camellia sinensis var. sinensis]
MDSRAMLEKPHAVCIPFPVQGHINPMLKLAKLLHNRGFHITFVNTEFNHKRLLKSRGPDSLNGLPSFRFEAIPDGLPESDADATQEIPSLLEATSKHCLAPFKDLIYKLNNTATSNVPQVTCIVSDAIMCFTLAVAEELGIPHVFFWSAGACGFMGMLQYRNLIEKGFLPVKAHTTPLLQPTPTLLHLTSAHTNHAYASATTPQALTYAATTPPKPTPETTNQAAATPLLICPHIRLCCCHTQSHTYAAIPTKNNTKANTRKHQPRCCNSAAKLDSAAPTFAAMPNSSPVVVIVFPELLTDQKRYLG